MTGDEIQSFWQHYQAETPQTLHGFNPAPRQTLTPPAWSFGADEEEADELLALVLEGTKTATSSALRDYEAAGEALPTRGELSIITDGAGHPHVLIATTQVRTVPFGEVDAAHARDEGEGDLSLEHWRRVHRDFFTASAGGAEVTDDMPVVLERFEVLYAR